jgi:hypothetical protein
VVGEGDGAEIEEELRTVWLHVITEVRMWPATGGQRTLRRRPLEIKTAWGEAGSTVWGIAD